MVGGPGGFRPAEGKADRGSTVTLKLKTADFRAGRRARSLENPTQLAGTIFAKSRELLAREIKCKKKGVLGVGVSAQTDGREHADPADLIDTGAERGAKAERAMDRVRGKFGHEAVARGTWRWTVEGCRCCQAVTSRACHGTGLATKGAC